MSSPDTTIIIYYDERYKQTHNRDNDRRHFWSVWECCQCHKVTVYHKSEDRENPQAKDLCTYCHHLVINKQENEHDHNMNDEVNDIQVARNLDHHKCDTCLGPYQLDPKGDIRFWFAVQIDLDTKNPSRME